MNEVSGALIATNLVLLAVFVPTAFMPGIPGMFYREFAITIAVSSIISLVLSLTLSPALAALLLKPRAEPSEPREAPAWLRPVQIGARKFNEGFDWLSEQYGKITAQFVRLPAIMLALYAGLLAATVWLLSATPTGFIPEQDQGYLIGAIQLPPGASLERTDAVVQRAVNIAQKTPGVAETAAIAGLDGASFSLAPNSGTIFIKLADFDDRRSPYLSAAALAQTLGKNMRTIQNANIVLISPPAVPGLGTGGGIKMMVQDRASLGYEALERATTGMMREAQGIRDVRQVFTLFNTGSPRVTADVDRDRAQMVGVQPQQIYNALNTYLGSAYVNDFNLFGRTFRVTAQAEPDYRDDLSDIGALQVRSSSGAMVPIASVATLRNESGAVRVVRYNLFPAAELQGSAAPGVSTGDALAAMERLAEEALPEGFDYEWTETAFQERQVGNTGAIVFLLAVVFVFLVLAAQYEAFTTPLAVVLIVPMCILAAIVGVNLRGQDNNILTQIGLIVLVGLAAKNAILIVEFAKKDEERGMDRFEAAAAAARTRLRAILMTSASFIVGMIPLVVAVGAGAEMRQALGTAVLFGMAGVTLFGLLFTPVFYVVCRWLAARLPFKGKQPSEIAGNAS
jgi:hydrophobe/amphiphile efflux-1 (HAE1) family protein